MKKCIQYNKCCVLCYQRGTDMLKKHSTEITRTVLKSIHSYSDLASVQGQMKERKGEGQKPADNCKNCCQKLHTLLSRKVVRQTVLESYI